MCDTSEVRRFVVLLLALTVARSADKSPPKPLSREQAAAIIANARKIVSANGIERLEKVRIGRIERWVSIRGYDNRNPVLLFIHAGPDSLLDHPVFFKYSHRLFHRQGLDRVSIASHCRRLKH